MTAMGGQKLCLSPPHPIKEKYAYTRKLIYEHGTEYNKN